MSRQIGASPVHTANVLLIDDEVDTLDEMSLCLTDRGYHCITASSAGEARDAWRTSQPIGVVVTDVRLPDVDGLALLAQLVTDESIPAPEGVVITGHGNIDTAITALRLHVADFLRKPVGSQELIAAVDMALDRYNARSQAVAEQTTLAAKLLRSTSERLGDLIRELSPASSAAAALVATEGDEAEGLVEAARKLIDQRAMRFELFEDDVLVEIGIDMLLELLLAELEMRPVYIRNLCLASRLPMSTALRRISDLERLGLLSRAVDPMDRRRVIVQLSAEGTRRMRAYVGQISRA